MDGFDSIRNLEDVINKSAEMHEHRSTFGFVVKSECRVKSAGLCDAEFEIIIHPCHHY